MDYITTTQLRTKSSELVSSISKGETVRLVHRSKVIGEIKPKQEAKVFSKEGIEALKRLAADLNFPKTTYAQREKIYRAHLMKKYGKGLPRR